MWDHLTQCFSTGVPRNPRVPWSTSKGSARFDKFVCFIDFIDMYIGEMAYCSFILPNKAIEQFKEKVKLRLLTFKTIMCSFVPQNYLRGSSAFLSLA